MVQIIMIKKSSQWNDFIYFDGNKFASTYHTRCLEQFKYKQNCILNIYEILLWLTYEYDQRHADKKK